MIGTFTFRIPETVSQISGSNIWSTLIFKYKGILSCYYLLSAILVLPDLPLVDPVEWITQDRGQREDTSRQVEACVVAASSVHEGTSQRSPNDGGHTLE